MALKTLAAEGFVQLLPNRGAVVASLDAQLEAARQIPAARQVEIAVREREDAVADSTLLLDYLREMHGNKEEKKKITLTRKQTSEIRKTDATGKYRFAKVFPQGKMLPDSASSNSRLRAAERGPAGWE